MSTGLKVREKPVSGINKIEGNRGAEKMLPCLNGLVATTGPTQINIFPLGKSLAKMVLFLSFFV